MPGVISAGQQLYQGMSQSGGHVQHIQGCSPPQRLPTLFEAAIEAFFEAKFKQCLLSLTGSIPDVKISLGGFLEFVRKII